MNSLILTLLAIQALRVVGDRHICDFHRSIQQLDFIRGTDVRVNCTFQLTHVYTELVIRWWAAKTQSSFGYDIKSGDGFDHGWWDPKHDQYPTKMLWGANNSSNVLTILNATEHYGFNFIFCAIHTSSCPFGKITDRTPLTLLESK